MNNGRIRTLTYHDVARTDGGPSGMTGAGRGHYRLTWERFLEHLETIEHAAGAPPAILDDWMAAGGGHEGWCLTFDDGGASAVDVAEELHRRGWRGYFFITTSLIGRPGFVDKEALREVDWMGHVVGSHTVTHPARMHSMPADKLLWEWEESAAVLSELIDRDVRTASVPGGSYSRRVALLAAAAGITTLFTSKPVTAPRWVDDCLVVGRYPIRRATSAKEAARAATGHPAPWVVHYVGWSLRKAAKAAGGTSYDRARRLLLNARYASPARR